MEKIDLEYELKAINNTLKSLNAIESRLREKENELLDLLKTASRELASTEFVKKETLYHRAWLLNEIRVRDKND
ncbi:hypothetical protein C9I98_17655 [Photobacterium sanctipauli]|uniref:Uncharacterized protein n=1 Tax=Photobacterium sanctipauli TaxID=1342794 RepID=A0A2T3NPK0_9GAMM|nr:hypothetical protein [Photobacterium sanctipauli]PSW18206.1 hypothetical protein C9I98_17655 [Photobacterium sanctipauli]